ncbi:uncharacterized protein PAC_01523 [Phialocephala subalpina]|uniref:2EXR domain-containing protein n=1 Tax=Phialocephala subalpina TaxID=576137 RepID=A0A1L7WFU1_9HELO|nr:uncharacterized protein PAC_01523 [Phialocephala subalpina]
MDKMKGLRRLLGQSSKVVTTTMSQDLQEIVTSMSGVQLSDPPPAFGRFPDLPKELQLNVWEEAVPKGRLIVIQVASTNKLISTNTPPAVFKVCKASREVALGQLTSYIPLSGGARLHFDSNQDRILIDPLTAGISQFPVLPILENIIRLNPRFTSIFKDVKNLSIPAGTFALLVDRFAYLQQFPSLETLVFIMMESDMTISAMAKHPESWPVMEDITAGCKDKFVDRMAVSNVQPILDWYRHYFGRSLQVVFSGRRRG